MTKLFFISLFILILLIFGCTSSENTQTNQNTNNNQENIKNQTNNASTTEININKSIEQRIPSFSCVSKTVLDDVWHCVQIFTDTPKDTADWWQENCEMKIGNARSISNDPCEIEGYRCMTPNNWTAEYYYEVSGTEIIDDIKNKCEKIE